jgi:methionine-gamma-lyase
MRSDWGFSTRAIHNEKHSDKPTGALSHPVVPAVAYAFDSAEEAATVVDGTTEGRYYGRFGNETTDILEGKLADLEHAEASLSVSSGMAAISIALMAYLDAGDHVVVTRDVYGGTHKFLTVIAEKYGIHYDYVDCTSVSAIQNAVKSNTRVIYIETPSNPKLTLIDIEAVSSITKDKGIKLIVDNTFMTPYLQNPLVLGADIVVHSATKYLNGHGDVVAGIICGRKMDIDHMRYNIMGQLGQNLNAWEAFLILRGIKTLGVRMEKHCSNALKVAHYLSSHPMVEKVHYPGLPSHPQNELVHRQMRLTGGIIAFEVKGGAEWGKKFINDLKMALISFSLGDPETLVQHPASMTHSSIPEHELMNFGISPGLIRLSIGLEEPEDIINDLDHAFSTLQDNVSAR